MDKRIVITGIGIISPAGFDKHSFWKALSKGVSAIRPARGFDCRGFPSKKAAQIKNFKPEDYVLRNSIRNLDNITLYALAAANLAVKDSSLPLEKKVRKEYAVVLGSMYSGLSSIAEFHRQMLEYKAKRVNPLLFPNTVPNAQAGQIAIELGLNGPNNSLSTGFASGIDALGTSFNYLRSRRAKAVLSGGIEELNVWLFGSFSKMGYLSMPGRQAGEGCRPFDRQRNGLILGEGAGILVLETADNALKRKAHIYAEVSGYGSSFDNSRTADGLSRAISLALEDAQAKTAEVDCIISEGASVISGDKLETLALKKALGEFVYKIPVTSIKPVLGHALGASGAFNVIAGLMGMENNTVIPTVNYRQPDPECDLDYAPNAARKKQINTALAISGEPGKNYACLVLKKWN